MVGWDVVQQNVEAEQDRAHLLLELAEVLDDPLLALLHVLGELGRVELVVLILHVLVAELQLLDDLAEVLDDLLGLLEALSLVRELLG